MLAQTDDKYANVKESAQCSYDAIAEMVANLTAAYIVEDDDAIEAAQDAIRQDPLSIEIKYGWKVPGIPQEEGAEEYAILLATGGPAIRVHGKLNKYSEPETAYIEVQDWFGPWQRFDPPNYDESILLTYAQSFWFAD